MSDGERYDGDEPPLSDSMKQIAKNVMRQSYTFLPCSIVVYDPVRQCADVAPVVQTQAVDKTPVVFPVLTCCPVLWPAGGGFSFVFPLLPGDLCMVGFTTIAMAQWWATGSPVALPESSRRGSLSDGFVMPGLRPQTLPLAAPVLGSMAMGKDDGTAGIVVDVAGNVQINAVAGVITALATLHQVGTGALSVAQAEAIHVELGKISTAIGALGGVYTPPLTPSLIATALSRSD